MRKGCMLLCLVFIQTVSSLESLITWLYLSYLNVRIKLKHQFFELSFILGSALQGWGQINQIPSLLTLECWNCYID